MQKKIYFFSVAVFFAVFVLRKTQLGKITTQGNASFGSHVHIGKNSILGCFWELSY
jgi:hypothetical protein